MSIFGIFVKYKDGTCNINEASYYYEVAKNIILNKIKAENLHKIDDYTFYDNKNEITYQLKSIYLYSGDER